MRYTIDHLLSGDAYWYHKRLTEELSKRYRIAPLHEKMEPHITIKAPFKANEYELHELEYALELFSKQKKPETIYLEGFGHFGHKTIFMDVVKSRGAVLLARDLLSDLRDLDWLSYMPHEGTKLHSSVARFMTHRQYRRVWRHVKKDKIKFKQTIQSLVIMQKAPGQKKWEEYRRFELRGETLEAFEPEHSFLFRPA